MATDGRPRHLQIPAGRGRRFRVLAGIVEAKLTEPDTGGAYTVFEISSPPGGGAALLHSHPPQETFYVLEGTYDFYGIGADGPYALRDTVGACVQVGSGVAHGFRNVGDTAGRVLVIYEPPGKMRALFEAIHAEVDNPDPLLARQEDLPHLERILEIFEEHDMIVIPGQA